LTLRVYIRVYIHVSISPYSRLYGTDLCQDCNNAIRSKTRFQDKKQVLADRKWFYEDW
jgi:hypothetical protein